MLVVILGQGLLCSGLALILSCAQVRIRDLANLTDYAMRLFWFFVVGIWPVLYALVYLW